MQTGDKLTEDMEDLLNLFISSSANYDPASGVFIGDLGMDIVSARYTDEECSDQFRVQQTVNAGEASGCGTGTRFHSVCRKPMRFVLNNAASSSVKFRMGRVMCMHAINI